MELPDAIFKQALDNALDIIIITNVNQKDPGDNTIVYVNDAFVRHFGYSKEEIIGQSPRLLQGEETDMEARNRIRDALREGQSVQSEIINYDKQGNKYWIDLKMVPLFDNNGTVSHFLFIERDLSQRKKREKKLYQEATIDGLTQIYNRHHTHQLGHKVVEHANRYKGRLSAILFDIDHFKRVNDSYGHPIGDKVLEKLADTVNQQVRKADIFGRIGGEEFLILLPKISINNALAFANRIREKVSQIDWQPIGIPHSITISLGVVQFQTGESFDTFTTRADQALYKAKNSGRNRAVALSYEEQTLQ